MKYNFQIILVFLLFFSQSLQSIKKVTIIGTGYVGLIVGAGLADVGHDVTCCDIDEKKIKDLNDGVMPIYEPGLEDLVKKNSQNIKFTTDVSTSIKSAEIIMIAVGTPPKENDASDLTYLNAAAATIGQALKDEKGYRVICIKSTVPIGENKNVKNILKYYLDEENFDLVSNPEFLRAGKALSDLYEKNPISTGSISKKALQVMKELYGPFIKPETPLIPSHDFATAEMAKYAWNSLVAMKVSFVNDLSRFCNETGADISKVIEIVGYQDRVLPFKNVKPGPGLGGSCLPKDTRSFVKQAEDMGVNLVIVKSAIESSDLQKKFFVNKIYELLGKSDKQRTVGILGLSFKAGTDDIRNSPAITVIEDLLKKGAKIKAYDPQATENMRKMFPDIKYCNSIYEAVVDVDAVVALTDWQVIKNASLKNIASLVKTKIIIDGRNMFDPEELKENLFRFANLGRK